MPPLSAPLLARLFLDSAGAGTRLVRGSEGIGWDLGPQGEDATRAARGPPRAGTVWQGQTMRPRRPFALLDFPCSRSRMYRPASEASALCLPACGVCVYKYYHVAVSCSWVKLLA